MRRRTFIALGVFFLAFILAGGGGYWWHTHTRQPVAAVYKTPAESDLYVRFDMEAYDKILANYWNQLTEDQLSELFRLSLQKASNSDVKLATTTRSGAAEMLASAFTSATSTDQKKQLALNTIIVALYNLAPAGRAQLLSQKQEVVLRETVSNVHPATDLYQNLGLKSGASVAQVNTAYTEVAKELKTATTSDAKQKLNEAEYAHKVLSDSNRKKLYDEAKIEPTVFGKVYGKTLYFNLTQISPTTLQEFGLAIDAASTTPGLNSMILDMRGNIGGSLDFSQAFLGLFVGQNQYAFDLYRHGTYQPVRTTLAKFDELTRYKEIAILTDGMTQSTAELTTAAFKRYKLARVVGGKTRGWGTVENTYAIDTVLDESEKYALLLVNNITLDDTNQPVEGRGIVPDIDTSDVEWKSKLSQYFISSSLIEAIKQIATKPPVK